MKTAKSRALSPRAIGLSGVVGGAALIACVAVQGAPRSSIQPYLAVEQVFTADFNGGDVLTYTGVGGGVNASVATRRVEATISYDYQRRIAWEGNLDDDEVHTGIAAVGIKVIPDVLSFEAGALATRGQADSRVPVPGYRTADDANLADIYSVYAGPTLSTNVGPLEVNASYRLGYVHVDDDQLAGGGLPAGARRVDRYSSSTVHNASASIGMAPGEGLPVGWTVGAGYSREDSKRLDSRFEGKFVRGDVVLPVSPKLAVTAGVGYEEISSSQQDYLRDGAGLPVIGAGGELVADPSRPRLLAYDQSGLIWDAGVIWRPSPRTELQARVGRRYGGTTFLGSLEHRINDHYALTASVYDSVDSFGRLLVTDVAGLPRKFNLPRNGLGGIGGCVFGDPGKGGCFDDALQSANAFNFRNRGANVMFSGGRGPWSFGLGAEYSQRRYFAPANQNFALDGVTDRSFTLQASASRELTRSSGYDLDAYAGWYDSGIAGEDNSFSTGVTASYRRSILNERLQANVAAGVYTTQAGSSDSSVASVLFGLSYGF